MKGLLSVFVIIAMLLMSFPIVSTAEEGEVNFVITPEDIVNLGGWGYGPRYSGGSFRGNILADADDGKINDATFDFELSKSAVCNVWIHTLDYEGENSKSRTFELKLDGASLGICCTHGTEGWMWECIKNVDFSKGEHRFSFVDLECNARFDSVFVTEDLNFVPENTAETLKTLEETYPFEGEKNEYKFIPSNRPKTDIAVAFDNKWLEFDTEPIIENDSTLVPIRVIAESLGADVSWDDQDKTVTFTTAEKTIVIKIGSKAGLVNGEEIELLQPPVIEGGRTLVPLRFVSENLGADVSWDGKEKNVFITAPLPKNEYYSEALDGKNIIFIGNSYIYYGKTVDDASGSIDYISRTHDTGYFYTLCRTNGADVNVTNWTFGGHSLADILFGNCAAGRGCDGFDHDASLTNRNYDYVVFSSGSSDKNDKEKTWKNYKYILDSFRTANPDTKFIYLNNSYTVENNCTNILELLPKLQEEGVIICDWGGLVWDIIRNKPGTLKMDYNKNSFIVCQSKSDGYHQNPLSGYIMALMVYSAISGKSAVGQDFSFVGEKSVNRSYDFEAYNKAHYKYEGAVTNYPEIFQNSDEMKNIQELIKDYIR